MTDLMTVRHSNNDVLDDAVHDRKPYEQDRRAVRALEQGLGNPPSAGQVPRENCPNFILVAVFVLKPSIS